MTKITVFLFTGILVCLKAQRPEPTRPAFAVASVKPSDSKDRPAVGNFNGRGYGRNATLKMLIQTAYQVQPFQISGGPAWIGSDRFEVAGKADDPNTLYPQLRLMMQSLLEERFQLRVHKEARRMAIYSLVLAKGGARLKASADQTSPDATTPPVSPQDGPPARKHRDTSRHDHG
jgi:uncharacterized protein (TIGR03435 family)